MRVLTRAFSVRLVLPCLVAVACLAFAAPARATFVVTIEQYGVGSSAYVVMSGSGTLDLTGLTLEVSGVALGAAITPDIAELNLGSGLADEYVGVTGTSAFGSTGPGSVVAGYDEETGLPVAIVGAYGELFVPEGYTSGAALSATATFINNFNGIPGVTLADLGLTPGTYQWTWGPIADDDSFELDVIAQTAVPEPSVLLFLGTSLIGGCVTARWRWLRKIF
jgi:hypothetical protein